MKRKSYCVYIMGSLSGTLYIGVTGNLHKRAFEHKFHRMEGFTDRYDAERLLYWESYDDVHKAIAREKQLKGWQRAKKIALIESVNLHWLDLAKEWYPWMKTCGDGRDASIGSAFRRAAQTPRKRLNFGSVRPSASERSRCAQHDTARESLLPELRSAGQVRAPVPA